VRTVCRIFELRSCASAGTSHSASLGKARAALDPDGHGRGGEKTGSRGHVTSIWLPSPATRPRPPEVLVLDLLPSAAYLRHGRGHCAKGQSS
jgi:hypothetical protein